jgi:uncharacterized protein (DUF1778 family)
MARQLRAETPAKPLPVRLSDAERDRVKEAARVNGQNVIQFCRDALVTAADDCLESLPAHS